MKYYFEPLTQLKRPFGVSEEYMREIAAEAIAEFGLMKLSRNAELSRTIDSNMCDDGKQLDLQARLSYLAANYFPDVPTGRFTLINLERKELYRNKGFDDVLELFVVLSAPDDGYTINAINDNTIAKPTDHACKLTLKTGDAFVMDGDCWHTLSSNSDGYANKLILLRVGVSVSRGRGRHELIGQLVETADKRSTRHITPKQFAIEPNETKPYPEPVGELESCAAWFL